MKQEFITLNGKVSVDNETIFIHNFYLRASDNFVFKLIFAVVPWVIFFSILFSGFDDARSKMRLVIYAAVSLLSLIYAYELIFVESYARKIPVHKIVSCQFEKDRVGYITSVFLILRSGRRRLIRFRSFEGQHEAFSKLISQRITKPQLA